MNASTEVLATIGWHVQMVKPVEVMLLAKRRTLHLGDAAREVHGHTQPGLHGPMWGHLAQAMTPEHRSVDRCNSQAVSPAPISVC